MKLPLAGLCLLVLSVSANAGDARLPVDMPPPGYSGEVFVDANGCTFTRAELDGMTLWILSIDETGTPACGRRPAARPGPSDPVLASLYWRAVGDS